MVYYVIIRGPLGVGKSTIAERMAKILDAEYVAVDKVLEKHGLDKVDAKAECIPAKNFIKANKILLPKIKDKLKKGKIVIFDACFYHKEHIEHLTQNLPYQYYAFTLKAPVEVCVERDSKRKKTYEKDAAAAVHYLVSRFDYGIVIDTNKKTAEQTVKEIFSYLPKSKSKNI